MRARRSRGRRPSLPWTARGGSTSQGIAFGCMNHVGLDQRHGLIRTGSPSTGPAKMGLSGSVSCRKPTPRATSGQMPPTTRRPTKPTCLPAASAPASIARSRGAGRRRGTSLASTAGSRRSALPSSKASTRQKGADGTRGAGCNNSPPGRTRSCHEDAMPSAASGASSRM